MVFFFLFVCCNNEILGVWFMVDVRLICLIDVFLNCEHGVDVDAK